MERNGTVRFSPRVNTFLERSVPLCGLFSYNLYEVTLKLQTIGSFTHKDGKT